MDMLVWSLAGVIALATPVTWLVWHWRRTHRPPAAPDAMADHAARLAALEGHAARANARLAALDTWGRRT